MRKYETMFIVNPTIDDESRNALLEKIKALIEANGEIISYDEWGKRRLAYKIDKHAEGYYVLIQFTANPEFIKELERVYKITDGILRFLVVKLEK